MSKQKPTATAVIRFFADKTVTVDLDSLVGVNPRRLERAAHLLIREYRGKRHAHNAKRHRIAREEEEAADAKAIKDDAAWHEAEDKRLAEAAAAPDVSSDLANLTINELRELAAPLGVTGRSKADLIEGIKAKTATSPKAETNIPEGGSELT